MRVRAALVQALANPRPLVVEKTGIEKLEQAVSTHRAHRTGTTDF
jgi:hypothetical protein